MARRRSARACPRDPGNSIRELEAPERCGKLTAGPVTGSGFVTLSIFAAPTEFDGPRPCAGPSDGRSAFTDSARKFGLGLERTERRDGDDSSVAMEPLRSDPGRPGPLISGRLNAGAVRGVDWAGTSMRELLDSDARPTPPMLPLSRPEARLMSLENPERSGRPILPVSSPPEIAPELRELPEDAAGARGAGGAGGCAEGRDGLVR
jgi:hypothetical protein